jgi:hypothetical protein
LFVTGVVLLLLQTFAPLLSFAAQGLWLPQGRYLFSGMALIASVMACGWINWLDGRGRWVALAFVVIILSVVDLAAIQAVRGFFAL